MALIKCSECNREISDKAKSCLNCGCPLEEMGIGGSTRIKIPNNVVHGWVGLLSSRNCCVKDSNDKVLWSGSHGENAQFHIDEPTDIIVILGTWANSVSGKVEPRKKYSIIQDTGMHMLATYRLTEVDVIDAD